MSNSFYNPTAVPGTSAALSSATMRAEFAAIGAAFDKLPTLSGNGGKVVQVNSGGTALEAVSTLASLTVTALIAGSLTVTGATSLEGSTAIGNAAGDTLTIAPSAVTWSNNPTHSGNHTFSGVVRVATGLVSAPSLEIGESGTGLWKSGTGEISFTQSSTNKVTLDLVNNTVRLEPSQLFGWSSGDPATTAIDVALQRDAADILAQRRTTTAQTFRVYTTFTDASNYERLNFDCTSSAARVLQESAGTGTARPLLVGTVGASDLSLVTNNTARWKVQNATGHFLGNSDNVSDIGASGATRPRSLYWGTQALGPDGTNANPTYAFASDPDTGVKTRNGIGSINLVHNGVSCHQFTSGSLVVGNSAVFAFSSGDPASVGGDVILNRDAANVLALRNGTTAQTYRVYNTFTDASNYVRWDFVASSSTQGTITYAGAGTGAGQKNILITGSGSAVFGVGTVTGANWGINSSGHLLAGTNNTNDIGASGATSPRSIYVGTSILLPNTGLRMADTNASHFLIVAPGSDITADRTLTITTGDADRTISIAGNITTAGAFITSGANSLTLTTTNTTNVTLPTTGTLSTLAGAEALTNKSLNGMTVTASTGTFTLTNSKTFAVSNSLTLVGTDSTTLTFPGVSATIAALNIEDQALTGGVIVTSKDLGTVTTGTTTPDPGDRPQQHYINGGAHTLAPSSNAGSILLDITNNGSAGAITTSGFTKVAGDSFTTTNGHKFRCAISVGNAGSLLVVRAFQ